MSYFSDKISQAVHTVNNWISFPPQKDPVMEQRAQEIADRITSAAGLDPSSVRVEVDTAFKVTADSHFTDDGVCHIQLHSGIWNPKWGWVNPESEDELAALIAHPIAHCALKTTDELEHSVPTYTILEKGVRKFLRSMGNLTWTAEDNPAEERERTAQMKIEQAADYATMLYLQDSGYTPEILLRMWDRADERPNYALEFIVNSHRRLDLEDSLAKLYQNENEKKDSSAQSFP